ncbi:MAG: hypothetical protein IH968_18210 [Gemmatimonadetes bacterium]|nr:hypothetical protein [Gemmatimonadota bacterium]
MKVFSAVVSNAHKQAFEVEIEGATRTEYPYSQCCPAPTREDPVARVELDPELGFTGFVYFLASGSEGVVLSDHILRYNRDPSYLVDEMLYELSCEAKSRLESSPIGIRALSRRLETSPAQIYRLVDPTNYGKTLDQMVRVLTALEAEVELLIR